MDSRVAGEPIRGFVIGRKKGAFKLLLQVPEKP